MNRCMMCGKRSKRGEEVLGRFLCLTCAAEAKKIVKPKLKERLKLPKVTSGKQPTEEQERILLAALERPKVLLVSAGAGTGKTTTLRMLADVLPGIGQYTAFNTSLVNDTKPKFRNTRVACNTTHSLAFRAIGKEYSHRLNSARVRSENVAKMLGIEALEVAYGEGKKRLAPGFLASRVMDAIRRFCQSADRELSDGHFRYIDGIDLPKEDGGRTYDNNSEVRKSLLPFARKAWEDLRSKEGHLPFSHDHYVKIWQLGKPVIAADYVLLDESQDTAEVMLDIIRQQTCPVILVGDAAQQIYEWRGAVNAMTAFPGSPEEFLSQSFRFGPAIAEVANQVLETLEEKTTLRLKGLESIQSRVGPVERPVAILCRTNAVAVNKLLTAIAEGRRPFLVGGGADVISFVEAAIKLQKPEPTSHPDLACFSSWTEVQEYAKMDEGEDLRLMVKLIDGFGATVILEALRAMPMEKDADLVISTAHKSKGREWDSVLLANDFPTESRAADPDRKLLYVAVTRAKLELDVSECPFFTGDDSLDVEQVIASGPKPTDIPQLLPPAPSAQPPGEFTWSRGGEEGKWCVRGPEGFEGKYVTVTRKDGSKADKFLISTVWSKDGVSLYRV